MNIRAGIGYDIHRLVPDRPLVLGGVTIDWDRGLSGHSDADVVLHAVMDALLGAAALQDIGHHFPPDDQRWRDAPSTSLLTAVGETVSAAGYAVINIDVMVVAEAPKLSPYRDAMRSRIAGSLGIEVDRVSVKATTNEGVGPEGQGQAISAQAIALIERVI